MGQMCKEEPADLNDPVVIKLKKMKDFVKLNIDNIAEELLIEEFNLSD